MNILGALFSLITAGLLFGLPRRWAPLPLLMGATYIPVGQEAVIGPFHFTLVRILVVAGLLRVMMKGERLAGGLRSLDRAMLSWALVVVCTSVFHHDVSATMIYRLGIAFESLGIFLLFRIFVQDPNDLRQVFRIICVLMVPVAMGMIVEKFTGKNCFASAFGDAWDAEFRQGSYRARGPFVHAILAGTIGAACLPMAIYLWRKERTIALAGIVATGGIVFASGSSGPIMTMLTILAGIVLWKQRRYMRAVYWLTLLLIFALSLAMNDPVYYLLARIDITGGSTGYHRAALIQAAIDHFSEWWFAGTDHTRHWMASGIPANENHTDITNHYLAMGVLGGMPLLLLFVWVLVAAITAVSKALRRAPRHEQFMIWILGSTLFGHATTFLSISYYAQAIFFLYFLLGSIGSIDAMWTTSRIGSPGVRRRSTQARQVVPEFQNSLS